MVVQSLSGGARATEVIGATLGSAHLRSPGLYLRMRSQMALRAYGSTPAVGSSKITARDPPTKAMATDSFLFMPPERVCTREWRLLESSRSSIILGTWEKRQGCRGGAVLAPSACGGAHDTSSPHLRPSATGTAQLQPGYRSIFFWLPQLDTPSFGKHLVELLQGTSLLPDHPPQFSQQEGGPLMQKAQIGQKELEGAYLSISLRISSSAMLLSCE